MVPPSKRNLIAALSLAGMVLGTAAAQASPTTLSATVTPTTAGSSASPAGHTITTSLSHVGEGSSSSPNAAVPTLTESFPADVQANFSSYATCPPGTVVHQDNKPSCPDGSILGHLSASAYVP